MNKLSYDEILGDILNFDTGHENICERIHDKIFFPTSWEVDEDMLIDTDIKTMEQVQKAVNEVVLTIFFRELLINVTGFSVKDASVTARKLVSSIKDRGIITQANQILYAYSNISDFSYILNNSLYLDSSLENVLNHTYDIVKDMKMNYSGITAEVIQEACDECTEIPENPDIISVNLLYYNIRMVFVELVNAVFQILRVSYRKKPICQIEHEIGNILAEFGLIRYKDIIIDKDFYEKNLDNINQYNLDDAWCADITVDNISALLDCVILKSNFPTAYSMVQFGLDYEFAYEYCHIEDGRKRDSAGFIYAIVDTIEDCMLTNRSCLPFSSENLVSPSGRVPLEEMGIFGFDEDIAKCDDK